MTLILNMVRTGTVCLLLAAVAFAQGRRLGTPSRWDPPPDLPHLDSTPALQRALIDQLIKVMLDVDAGRDALDAKEKLIAIGPRAYPRIVSAMVRITDKLTDNNGAAERLQESSLKLADETLRRMDSYLDDKGKSTIRPGSEKKYIRYILRLHYKRWKDVLAPLAETDVHVFAVRDGGVNELRIERARGSVTLVLVSEKPGNWVIDNPHGIVVARVVTNGTLVNARVRKVEALKDPLPWGDPARLRAALPAGATFHARDKTSKFVLRYPGPLARDVEVHAIGIREAKNGVATVEVRKTAKPVVLVLMAQRSVGWRLALVDGARVAGVIVAGEEDQHVIGVPPDAALVERGFFAHEVHSERARAAEARVKEITGNGFASFQTAVSGATFVVK